MKCLVTGGAGFIGSSLSERLLALGHSVVSIDAFIPYYPRALKERNLSALSPSGKFTFFEGSLLDVDLVSLLNGVEWVFHQAAQAGVRSSWGDDFSTYTTHNVLATQRLLDAVRKSDSVQRVVYASSSSIYGDAESFPTPETLIPKPISPYGVTKLAGEHLMRLYATEFGVPAVSLRYFTVFGPRQRPDMAFNRFIRAGLTGEEIVIYGDGEQSRDFTYITDAVEANILAATKGSPGETYNIGGGTNATVNEVLRTLTEKLGPLNITKLDRQSGDARKTSADTTLARQVLGFKPQVSLEEGLKAEIEWLKSL